jgi:phosphoadenosine phosphosulfate reductase
MSALIEHLSDLRQAHGQLSGLGLLRALLREGPLHDKTALVSSFGAESAVLLDMVASVDPAIPVIFLDTGKLFPETHEYREELTALLGLTNVILARPTPKRLAKHDPDGSLWRREPDFCCDIRKTEPLEAVLAGFAAWITGRKRFQGGARASLPVIEGEVASGKIKINPLATWSEEDLERYRLMRALPSHPLVAQGYRSIGCTTCTRPVKPGEPARAGRWAGLDKTECGIHGEGI